MGSSYSSSRSEESASGDRDIFRTPSPKVIPNDGDFESGSGTTSGSIASDSESTRVKTIPYHEESAGAGHEFSPTRASFTASNDRNLVSSSRRPLLEIGAPNRILRSTGRNRTSITALDNYGKKFCLGYYISELIINFLFSN